MCTRCNAGKYLYDSECRDSCTGLDGLISYNPGSYGRECRAPFSCIDRDDGSGGACKCPRSVGKVSPTLLPPVPPTSTDRSALACCRSHHTVIVWFSSVAERLPRLHHAARRRFLVSGVDTDPIDLAAIQGDFSHVLLTGLAARSPV